MFEDLLPFVDPTSTSRIAAPSPTLPPSDRATTGGDRVTVDPTAFDEVSADDQPTAEVDVNGSATTLAWESRSHRLRSLLASPGRIAALLALLLVIGVGLIVGVTVGRHSTQSASPRRESSRESVEPSSAQEPPSQKAPLTARELDATEVTEPERATITVGDVPEGARVMVDDHELLESTISLRRDETSHRLSVEAAGYEPFEEVFTADRDRTLEVSLTPQEQRQPAKRRPAGRQVRRHREAPTETPASEPTKAAPYRPRYLGRPHPR